MYILSIRSFENPKDIPIISGRRCHGSTILGQLGKWIYNFDPNWAIIWKSHQIWAYKWEKGKN